MSFVHMCLWALCSDGYTDGGPVDLSRKPGGGMKVRVWYTLAQSITIFPKSPPRVLLLLRSAGVGPLWNACLRHQRNVCGLQVCHSGIVGSIVNMCFHAPLAAATSPLGVGDVGKPEHTGKSPPQASRARRRSRLGNGHFFRK